MTSRTNWNSAIIEEFRSHHGQVGGGFAGRPLLLLHTTGARSGQERVNPVAYIRDDGHLIIIASKGGSPTNPDWYHNLVAHPQVKVEVGDEQFSAQAAVAPEPERTRLYAAMVKVNPGFADYESKTSRKIPVVILTPEN